MKYGVSPGQLMVTLADGVPGYEEWFEEFLPTIMDYPGNTVDNE